MNYSVLMSVYKKDNPKWLIESIESMIAQTLPPEEFVIIEDGVLTKELEQIIVGYELKNKKLFTVKRFSKNRGLGLALASGVEVCRNEWIARIDADDIAVPTRCEKQVNFAKDEQYDIIGCLVDEFIDDTQNVKAHVLLPENHESIVRFAQYRTPFRHSAVLYKKSVILKAGNYRDFFLYEDYDLFTRMLMKGARGYNIQEPLTYIRINENFYMRRGGMKYFKSIFKLRKELYEKRFTSLFTFLYATLVNFVVCMMPNVLRKWIYMSFLRG